MYIKDGICYADGFESAKKVSSVKPLNGGMMIVCFSTGEKRLFDTTLLRGPAFEPLKSETVFNNPTIFHGVITWDEGRIDVAPETVYELSYEYSNEAI